MSGELMSVSVSWNAGFIQLFRHDSVAYFLVDKRCRVGGEPRGVEVMKCAEHIVEITWPHVLGGINTKPGHAPVHQLIDVLDNVCPHPSTVALQVPQTHQPTVANLDRIAVILCRTRRKSFTYWAHSMGS